MTADRLFNLACEFAEACAKAEGWKVRAQLEPAPADRAEAARRLDTWSAMLARKRDELRAALRDALPTSGPTGPGACDPGSPA